MEDLADDPGHEQDGNEHRHQRNAHRENGEGDFAGADHGGFEAVPAALKRWRVTFSSTTMA